MTQKKAADMSKIREVFNSWDTTNSGTITRDELAGVMVLVMKRPIEHVDVLMREIDTDGDGSISYDEFIDWVMNPEATESPTACGKKLQAFDFEKELKPLFDVYR